MKIEYYGHSCFRLTFADGTRIVTDPYGDIGYPMPKLRAEIVTVSHGHYDHSNVRAVDASAILTEPCVSNVCGVHITGIGSFHDDAGGAKRGKNTIFCFEKDGLKVCHLGDVGEPVDRLAGQLKGIDVLLLPVGGHYTVGAREAKRYVERLAPKFVIPMHYHTAGLNVDIAGADEFLSLFAEETVVRRGGTIELGSEAVAAQTQKIILMERIS